MRTDDNCVRCGNRMICLSCEPPLPLFEKNPYRGGIPPHSDLDTSRKAALSMLEAASTIRYAVFRFILTREGATCEEVELGLGLKHQTASSAIRSLVKVGLLVDSGERRVNLTGRRANVWTVTGLHKEIERC